jgi:hypothetical protein
VSSLSSANGVGGLAGFKEFSRSKQHLEDVNSIHRFLHMELWWVRCSTGLSYRGTQQNSIQPTNKSFHHALVAV